jgi:hypothetical protein
MKAFYYFTVWKTIKDNRNIGSQTEAILCIFFDFPCFFSRTELEVFLGYNSPNHNVEGALTKMVQERMIFQNHNKVGAEIYYLGNFGMAMLGRHSIPDLDIRQSKYIDPIVIRSENGHRVINSRQRANNTKRQEPPASNKTTVTPLAKKARPNPKTKLFSSDKESSKGTIKSPSKESKVGKEVQVIDNKSSSEKESEKSSSSKANFSSSNNSEDSEDSKVKIVDKDGKPEEEDAEDSDTPTQQQEKKAASSKNNHLGFMNQDDIDPIVTV